MKRTKKELKALCRMAELRYRRRARTIQAAELLMSVPAYSSTGMDILYTNRDLLEEAIRAWSNILIELNHTDTE